MNDLPGGPERAMEDVPVSRPYLSEDGELVVPADCAEEYRWWTKDGRKLTEILTELKVSKTVWQRYTPKPYPEELQRENYPLLGG